MTGENPATTRPEATHIVGIGASAGGLEALERFFENTPPDSGMAFVVIQHLSPDYKSMMAELLGKRTPMPVHQATDDLEVRPDTVYLIPPKAHLTIAGGRLRLSEQPTERIGANLAVDHFLKSLAEDAGERAIAVILSGTGSDGMRGVRAVKGNGGTIVIQDAATARFDGMPLAAQSTGLADFVLPPEEMGRNLVAFASHDGVATPAEERQGVDADEKTLQGILGIIREQTDLDFTAYRTNTVLRRIDRRVRINQLHNLADYLNFVQRSPTEIRILSRELLIGVTSFFRDRQAWSLLDQTVIPELLRMEGGDEPIRVWVVGCSTGEEAYSLAMLFSEHLDRTSSDREVKIFATDVDRESVEYASAGRYPESIAADLSPDRLARFFEHEAEGSYQVVRRLREMVVFAHQNVLRDPPFTRLHLISCRNLLIYFQPELQRRVVSLFSYALRPGGILWLGSSETVGELGDHFETVDGRWKLFRARGGGTAPDLADALGRQRGEPRLRSRMAGYAGLQRPEREKTVEQLLDLVGGAFAPAGIAVNEHLEPIHVFGDVSPYFTLPAGRVSFNVLKLAHPDLTVILSTAFNRVRKEAEPVVYRDVRIRRGEHHEFVNLRVHPVGPRGPAGGGVAAFFEPRDRLPAEEQTEVVDMDEHSRQRINDLEGELQTTRESLQATIEELETSNEELQATNEELLASNEELQSTNEELQSVNEELYTVNSEHQAKIQELAQLHDDLSNILSVGRVATIFIGPDLRIRKFTPSAAELLGLVQHDADRLFSDLAAHRRWPDLAEDLARAINEGAESERRLEAGPATLFARCVPYRRQDGELEGAVVSLTDITAIAGAEHAIEAEHEMLEQIAQHSPVAITLVDTSGHISWANRRAEQILGLEAATILGRAYDDPSFRITALDGGPFDPDDLPFARVRANLAPVEDARHAIEWPDGRRVGLSVDSVPLLDESGAFRGMVSTIVPLDSEDSRNP